MVTYMNHHLPRIVILSEAKDLLHAARKQVLRFARDDKLNLAKNFGGPLAGASQASASPPRS
jgi:hypothetical protein